MSWFEGSARVPLLVSYPQRFAPKTILHNVSAMDILPTLVDLVGGSIEPQLPLDGTSLLPYLQGAPEIHRQDDVVYGEYAGEGTIAPLMMIKRGPWKFVTCPADPPQLYHLASDPKELHNLATSQDIAMQEKLASFVKEANARWDFKKIHEDVLLSQRSRKLCWDALTKGRFESWDYQPKENAKDKYDLSLLNFAPHEGVRLVFADPFAGLLGTSVPMSLWMNSSFAHGIRPWINLALSWRGVWRRGLRARIISRSYGLGMDMFGIRVLPIRLNTEEGL